MFFPLTAEYKKNFSFVFFVSWAEFWVSTWTNIDAHDPVYTSFALFSVSSMFFGSILIRFLYHSLLWQMGFA